VGKIKTQMKKGYLFEVKTKAKIGNIPRGSLIYVEKELKRKGEYEGLWGCFGGTFRVKVPIDKCKKLDNLKHEV
jgi:hypothetical protein